MADVLSIYNVSDTLTNIDANIPRLLIFGGLALICNFVYFGVGIAQGLPLGLAGTTVAWLVLKTVLADELWLFTFGWTVWFCLPFVIPMMLRRIPATPLKFD